MKIPQHIDLKKIEETKRKILEERIKVIDQYAEWAKKYPIKSGKNNRKA